MATAKDLQLKITKIGDKYAINNSQENTSAMIDSMVIDKPRASSLKPLITKKRKICSFNNLSLDDLDQESEVAKWLINVPVKMYQCKVKI